MNNLLKVFSTLMYGCILIMLSACQTNLESGQSLDSNQAILKQWVDARAGTGKPVHWISEGGIYAYPSGEKLFGMTGFDSSTVIWPEDPSEPVIHLTRKTYTYTDVETGEVLTEYNGNKVEPIAYPYQIISYRIEDGVIYGDVEQGVEPNVRTIKAQNGMTTRKLGTDTLFVNAAVFLDFPLPNGDQYEAWENYDFFFQNPEKVDRPYQLTWQRYGARPKWAGEGKAIYHLMSWRVEDHNEFPTRLLEWAKKNQPMWLTPPSSLDEIRSLQKGDAMEGWAK